MSLLFNSVQYGSYIRHHKYFALISHAFPSLSSLSLVIRCERKKTSEETSSIIEFSCLTELRFRKEHIDYVEQFLSDDNTRVPCLSKPHIKYAYLATVTKNFTRTFTRINVKYLTFHGPVDMVHSKDFYLYFPSL